MPPQQRECVFLIVRVAIVKCDQKAAGGQSTATALGRQDVVQANQVIVASKENQALLEEVVRHGPFRHRFEPTRVIATEDPMEDHHGERATISEPVVKRKQLSVRQRPFYHASQP